MSSHIVPIDNMTVSRILTGYETIVPIKAGGRFVTVAAEDGQVTKVTKSTLSVQYKPNGEQTYRRSWYFLYTRDGTKL